MLANQTPLEVIRDHGTLVGASLAWDREVWDVLRAAVADRDLRRLPDLLPRGADRRDPSTSTSRCSTTAPAAPRARPTDKAGWNHLYGFRIKDLRWHRSFWLRYLADMETVEPPDAEECRRLCREKIARADFLIGLAETPRGRLPLSLPKNLWRSIATRDPLYLTETREVPRGPALPGPPRRQGPPRRRPPDSGNARGPGYRQLSAAAAPRPMYEE